MIQKLAHIAAGEVRLQRPGGVGIAEGRGEIGDPAIHHRLVADRLGHVLGFAVDNEIDPGQQLHVESGRRHDHIGFQLLARFEQDALFGEAIDMTGDHRGAVRLDRLKQVAVGHQAEPLVPDIVAGREMRFHVISGRQLGGDAVEYPLVDLFWRLPGAAVEIHAEQYVLPARDPVGQARGKDAAQKVRDPVFGGARDHVGRRALQHHHVRGVLRHLGHQGHRRRTAADHDHALAAIVELLGPMLRVDDRTPEALAAGELGRIAFLVAIIAAAHEEEVAAEEQLLLLRPALHLDLPGRCLGRPGRTLHPVLVADMLVDAVIPGGLPQILLDRGAVSDGLGFLPGAEGEAQRVHVRIRSDAGIAEQVPGAAQIVAPFQDHIAFAGAQSLQVIAGIDPGNSCANHQHVDSFCLHRALSSHFDGNVNRFGPESDSSIRGRPSALRDFT
ncbi:hypothetical protein VF09_06710 [Nostoc linckia z9]|nr:hypothetical protein VF09_06710 [Nostoc linckia z9]